MLVGGFGAARRVLSLAAALGLALGIPVAADAPARAVNATPGDLSLSAGRLTRVSGGSVSVSGSHVLRRSASNEYTVRHGPLPVVRLTGLPAEPRRIKQSGPYSLVGGTVFVAAPGNRAKLLFDTGTDATDLFGPHLVWTTPKGQVRQKYLYGDDSGRPVLARSGAAGPVAVWGPWSAWLGPDGTIHVLGNLGFERRAVRAGPRARDLRLNNNLLSWTARDNSVHLIDLGRTRSHQHRARLRPPYAIDGNRMAGVDASGQVTVLPLKTRTLPAWLISQQTTTLLEVGRPWKPRFDVSKPLEQAKLVIYGSGSPVRVLTSSARYGTVGGFRWDGKDSHGKPVPPSCYTWRFSAPARDGSGPVVGDLGPNPGGALNLTPVGGWPGGIGMSCWSDFD